MCPTDTYINDLTYWAKGAPEDAAPGTERSTGKLPVALNY